MAHRVLGNPQHVRHFRLRLALGAKPGQPPSRFLWGDPPAWPANESPFAPVRATGTPGAKGTANGFASASVGSAALPAASKSEGPSGEDAGAAGYVSLGVCGSAVASVLPLAP